MYDEYISIGDNCEAGLNFWRIGYDYSTIFRFSRGNLKDYLLLLNENFEGGLESFRAISDDMICCNKYRVSWHSDIKSKMLDGKRIIIKDPSDVECLISKEKDKLGYLMTKWRQDINSSKRIAFFYKNNDVIDLSDVENFVSYVKGINPNLLFKVIVLHHEGQILKGLLPECSILEEIKFFAPYNDAYGYSVDCWNNIFNKHPINPSRVTGEYSSKAKRANLYL